MFSITFPSINSFLPYFVHFFKISTCTPQAGPLLIISVFWIRSNICWRIVCWTLGLGEGGIVNWWLLHHRSGFVAQISSQYFYRLWAKTSLWWSRDGCLAHLLPYSVASLRQGWGSRLLRKAAGASSQFPHLLSCLICWWGLCRTLPGRFAFQHLVILIKSSLKLLGSWDGWF